MCYCTGRVMVICPTTLKQVHPLTFKGYDMEVKEIYHS